MYDCENYASKTSRSKSPFMKADLAMCESKFLLRSFSPGFHLFWDFLSEMVGVGPQSRRQK